MPASTHHVAPQRGQWGAEPPLPCLGDLLGEPLHPPHQPGSRGAAHGSPVGASATGNAHALAWSSVRSSPVGWASIARAARASSAEKVVPTIWSIKWRREMPGGCWGRRHREETCCPQEPQVPAVPGTWRAWGRRQPTGRGASSAQGGCPRSPHGPLPGTAAGSQHWDLTPGPSVCPRAGVAVPGFGKETPRGTKTAPAHPRPPGDLEPV